MAEKTTTEKRDGNQPVQTGSSPPQTQPQPQTQTSIQPSRREEATPEVMHRDPWMSGSPFSLMRRLTDEMDRLFEAWTGGSPFGGLFGTTGFSGRGWRPAIEVLDRGDHLVVRAELPGIKPEQIDVSLDDDILTIRGERRMEQTSREAGVTHSERSYGSFARSVRVPRGTDPSAIQASYDDGVLEVTVPRPSEGAGTRHIPVSTGGRAAGKPQTGGAKA